MIIAVVGLAREARIVGGPGILVSRRGLDLLRLVTPDTEGIISIGIAAGLDPALRVGDCVIAARVMAAGRTFDTTARWTNAVRARLASARIGAIAASDAPVTSAEAKSTLFANTAALAADMESHLAAIAAAEAGIPFAALRVISDDADCTLPPAALAAMRADGSIDLGAVIGSLISRPTQIGALMRTGRDAETAFGALLRCRRGLGPRLAFPDLG